MVRVNDEGRKGSQAFLNSAGVLGGNRYSRPRALFVRFVAITTPTDPANPGLAGGSEERAADGNAHN